MFRNVSFAPWREKNNDDNKGNDLRNDARPRPAFNGPAENHGVNHEGRAAPRQDKKQDVQKQDRRRLLLNRVGKRCHVVEDKKRGHKKPEHDDREYGPGDDPAMSMCHSSDPAPKAAVGLRAHRDEHKFWPLWPQAAAGSRAAAPSICDNQDPVMVRRTVVAGAICPTS